jgi:L-arabinose isomerase
MDDEGDVPAMRIGLFSIGLDVYWPQFPGLLERLNGYNAEIAERLRRKEVEVVNLGMIDTPGKASCAGHELRRMDVDLIFVHVATYALSSTVLPAVRRPKSPVVILNLAPGAAIDYAAFNRMRDRERMTGEWLAWCQNCPVSEIANVFQRAGVPFHEVTGMLQEDEAAWAEIDSWIEAAQVAHVLEHNRLGLMGHYYGGMLDVYSDITRQCAYFGGHLEMLEVDELSELRKEVTAQQVRLRRQQFLATFDVRPDCPPDELDRAARTSVALDKLVQRHHLGSLAYYYRGTGIAENEDAVSSIILGSSLLTAQGVPVAGEYEVKNVQAMKIMDCFGAGGSFTEHYATDFNEDVVLMGHDGPGHISIAEGKIKVRPLGVYHGKVGRGLSVEMSVKHGDVTLLSVVETKEGKIKLLIAEGQSVPGLILEIGNTNSRYRFSIGARRFIQDWNAQGPAHHCAVGLGHIAGKLERLALLLNLEAARVC